MAEKLRSVQVLLGTHVVTRGIFARGDLGRYRLTSSRELEGIKNVNIQIADIGRVACRQGSSATAVDECFYVFQK